MFSFVTKLLLPSEIKEIKDDFVAGIKQRELMSKRINKYIAFFD